MSLAASRIVATRAIARRVTVQQHGQKRGIVDYLTNYPDKVRKKAPTPTTTSANASSSPSLETPTTRTLISHTFGVFDHLLTGQ